MPFLFFLFLIFVSSDLQAESKLTGSELIKSKFTLVNHLNESVTERDFYGKYMLVFLSAVFYRYGLDCRSKEKACFRLKWKRAFSFILISFEILTVKADSYDHSKKFSGRKCQPDSGASKEYRKNINKCHHQNTSS